MSTLPPDPFKHMPSKGPVINKPTGLPSPSGPDDDIKIAPEAPLVSGYISYPSERDPRSMSGLQRRSTAIIRYLLETLKESGVYTNNRSDNLAFPILIFFSKSNADHEKKALAAIKTLSKSLDIDLITKFPEIRGSWFKSFVGYTKKAISSKEAQDIQERINVGLDNKYIHGVQADIDLIGARAISTVIKSIEPIPNVVFLYGSVLLVKVTQKGGPVVVVRKLTLIQLKSLEKNPELFISPAKMLLHLGEGVDSRDVTIEMI